MNTSNKAVSRCRIVQRLWEKTTPDLHSMLSACWLNNKTAFVSAMISGLMAYMWFFTNKIINHDEIGFMFSKGADLSSGRWGLKLLSHVFQNYSVPWLWGITTLFLLSIACCIIVRAFKIENRLLQIALSASIVCFPSEIGTMFYMFTTTSYALAFLLAVISVALLVGLKSKAGFFIALICAVFSISIYQAYITVVSSLLVISIIANIVNCEYNIKDIWKSVLYYLFFLVLALGIYYVINIIVMSHYNIEYNSWAESGRQSADGILTRIVSAFRNYFHVLVKSEHGILRTKYTKAIHLLLLLLSLFFGYCSVLHSTVVRKVLFLFFDLIVFSLSINGLTLLIGDHGVHTLTLYSYATTYVLIAILIGTVTHLKWKTVLSDFVSLLLLITASANIAYANKAGLEEFMEYENTYSVYQSVITQIQLTPGFDENSKIALIGTVPNSNYKLNFRTVQDVAGPTDFRNGWSRQDFISNYLGIDLQYTSDQENHDIQSTKDFQEMPTYPYYGYIKVIDDVVVVKFSE